MPVPLIQIKCTTAYGNEKTRNRVWEREKFSCPVTSHQSLVTATAF
ncbi:MAG: hypothetical protein ACKPEO_13500 [Sphaerospermopsis kisseleviana]|nr:hypothetical protein [Sphaerospermopsis sp. LEGE 00249]MBC5797350.1 hypothetical protein [Sphaerospermopsis sp. LEGE 00249]